MTKEQHSHRSTSSGERSPRQRILRWVGTITALLSLIFGAQQLVEAITDVNVRGQQITEFKQLAQLQVESGEFAMAWESVNSALKLADAAGTLAKLVGRTDSQTKELRVVRENIAMAWLDDMHTTGDQKFSDFVEKLLPALEQGAITATSQRKADLVAHIGWASFLRSRDGVPLDPRRSYEQALQVDSGNPYAHAYLAHWLVWTGGTLDEANEHFAVALNTGRVKEKVRDLQLAAYGNRQDEGDGLYVATVVEMIKSGEKVDADWRHRALWHFTRACSGSPNAELLADLKKRLAPVGLVEAYEKLRADSADKTQQDESVIKKVTGCLAAAK